MGKHDADLDDGFGYVSWKSCLRLRDYIVKGVEKGLIIETRYAEGGLIITEFGKQYYRENWQKYRELYPDVDAPEPVDKEESQK